jgi:predicted phosphohydrolase
MRILVSGDLHYQPATRPAYVEFAAWVRDQAPDCFILAGDVGHPLRLFRRGLDLFAQLTCPRLFIAGNHDLYCGEHDSRTLWERVLPEHVQQAGFVWLETTTIQLGDVGICGTLGWYDYSARAPYLPFGAADYRHLKPLLNHDADYIDWPWSDLAMARYLVRGFAGRLTALEQNPTIRQIVVVTHMPIFPAALPDYPESERYSLQRAYLGNFTLGETVRRAAKVTHVVSGHLHRRGRWQVSDATQIIDFRVIGSSRGRPDAVVIEI